MSAASSAQVRVRAAAKINLALKVGPVREDGYHPLATVFQAVSLYEDITATVADPGVFTVTVNGVQSQAVPTDERNLAIKAARLVADTYGTTDLGVALTIDKDIPVAGGMAGGSADCAATLLACSELWGLNLSFDQLTELGRQLGADVPFALLGGTALGIDRGDELVSIPSANSYHWVVAFTDFELSTPTVFRHFDHLTAQRDVSEPAVPQALFDALASGDVAALGAALVNDLQEPAVALRPKISQLLQAGEELGAVASLMSGSGPTCAFLVANEADGLILADQLISTELCRDARCVTGPVPGATRIT